jgi:ring-1,2-phenylacetyl-CoA epoxidase subunit PaaD
MVSVLPSREVIWAALEQVPDPEIPVVNVVEMGIVRDVRFESDCVIVLMTPTFSACPALHVIREQLERAVLELGVNHVEVRTVLSPAWTTDWITTQAQNKLLEYGIAPPGAVRDESAQFLQLEPRVVQCPQCQSFDTRVTNTFGPTLCKSIHVCNTCREPFESFKTL